MSMADLFVSEEVVSYRAQHDDTQIVGLIVLAWRIVTFWSDRARQRRVLAELDDHLLDDVGITRAQALEERRKPFWR
jgi:uncharacterized protein YjiS (DUF1127 family)